MPLGFINGAYNRASGTLNAFGGLSADLEREGHPPMVSRSGDREPDVQLQLWHERMVLAHQVNGRRVYGTKRWQGKTWYQIHPDTVAIPGSSNHERRRSNDLAWPYNSDTVSARRAKQLAPRHNITREGENFRELWHWTFWGALGAIGAPASDGSTTTTPATIQEDDMATLITGGGQNLVVGNQLIGLTPDQVVAIKGAQVLQVHPATHYNIIQAFQRANPSNAALPVVVYVSDGDGTVYLLDDGELKALVDPKTLVALHAQNAPTLTLSQAEVKNLLKD